MTESRFTARLFGSPTFSWKGTPFPRLQPKVSALLSLLCAEPSGATREELAELLWPPRRMQSVRQALHVLRGLPGASDWLDVDGVVRVNADVDVRAFEDARRAERFTDALDAWPPHAPFLQGVTTDAPPFEEWLAEKRAALDDARKDALRRFALEGETHGRFETARRAWRELAELDPLDEDACRHLMRLEARLGNVDGALLAFERTRHALDEELQASPSAETLAALHDVEGGPNEGGQRATLATSLERVPHPVELLGRAGDVERVVAALTQGGRVLVQGFGGVGKTALAASIARRFVSVDAPVLWMEVGTDATDAALDAVAEALGVREAFSKAPFERRGALLTDAVRGRGVALVVLDNVWNAHTLAALRNVLPSDTPLLVTARHVYPKFTRVKLGELPRRAAIDLLAAHAETTLDAADADALCALLQDHAFAVRLAGITLRQSDMTPRALHAALQARPHALAAPEEDVSVEHLLSVSVRALSDAAYEAFLALGSLFTPSATPALLSHVTRRDEVETEGALIELVTHGLAERHARPGRDTSAYRVHDLSHSYGRAREAHLPHSVARAALAFLHAYRDDLGALDADIANVLSAAEHFRASGDDRKLVETLLLLTVTGRYFSTRGQSPRLRQVLNDAAEAAGRLEDHAAAHRLYGKLGDLLDIYLGQTREAFDVRQLARAYAARDGDVGREAVYVNLMGVCALQQNWPNAAELFTEALALAQRANRPLETCAILSNQSYAYGLRGEFDVACDLILKALAMLDGVGKDAPASDIATNRFYLLANLGEVEFERGRVGQAVTYKRQALDIAEAMDAAPWQADVHGDLAVIALRTGDQEAHERHLSTALALYEQSGAHGKIAFLTSLMRQVRDAPNLQTI